MPSSCAGFEVSKWHKIGLGSLFAGDELGDFLLCGHLLTNWVSSVGR